MLLCLLLLTAAIAAASAAKIQQEDPLRLRKREKLLFRDALQMARRDGYTLDGFYHTSTWRGKWRQVVDEQLSLLAGARPLHGDLQFNHSSSGTSGSGSGSVPSYGQPRWASLLAASGKLHTTVSGSDSTSVEAVLAFLEEREACLALPASAGRARCRKTLLQEQRGAPARGRRRAQGQAQQQQQQQEDSTSGWGYEYIVRYQLQPGQAEEGAAEVGRPLVARLRLQPKVELHFARTLPRRTWEQATNGEKEAFERDPRGLSEGEGATLQALWEHCSAETAAGRKALVYYLHSKGSCCTRGPGSESGGPPDVVEAISDWREALNTFTVEFPSICLRALLAGYPTCGYGAQSGHYSGNFFWADCRHVAALSRPKVFQPWQQEMFILHTSASPEKESEWFDRCAYSPYHCGVNHYAAACSRSAYTGVVESYLGAADSPLFDTPQHQAGAGATAVAGAGVGTGAEEAAEAAGAGAGAFARHSRGPGAMARFDACRHVLDERGGTYEHLPQWSKADPARYFEVGGTRYAPKANPKR